MDTVDVARSRKMRSLRRRNILYGLKKVRAVTAFIKGIQEKAALMRMGIVGPGLAPIQVMTMLTKTGMALVRSGKEA